MSVSMWCLRLAVARNDKGRGDGTREMVARGAYKGYHIYKPERDIPSSHPLHHGRTHGARSYLDTVPHTVRIHDEKGIVRYYRGFLESFPRCRNYCQWPRH